MVLTRLPLVQLYTNSLLAAWQGLGALYLEIFHRPIDGLPI